MIFLRTKDGQVRHDKGVIHYANLLATKKYTVYADLPDIAKPSQIGEFVPDIYASLSGKEVVVEIETQDSVNSEHARNQNSAFGMWAAISHSREYYQKVV